MFSHLTKRWRRRKPKSELKSEPASQSKPDPLEFRTPPALPSKQVKWRNALNVPFELQVQAEHVRSFGYYRVWLGKLSPDDGSSNFRIYLDPKVFEPFPWFEDFLSFSGSKLANSGVSCSTEVRPPLLLYGNGRPKELLRQLKQEQDYLGALGFNLDEVIAGRDLTLSLTMFSVSNSKFGSDKFLGFRLRALGVNMDKMCTPLKDYY